MPSTFILNAINFDSPTINVLNFFNSPTPFVLLK